MDRLWKTEEGRQKMAGAQQPPLSPKYAYQPQAGLIFRRSPASIVLMLFIEPR